MTKLGQLNIGGRFEGRNEVGFQIFDSNKYWLVGNHIGMVREPSGDHLLET